MKNYVKFAVYANMPSLLILPIPAINNLFTGGNWLALMAFYNLVLYVIPMTIILAYLVRSLIKGLKPQRAYMVLYFVLSTVCVLLLIIAWFALTPFVALASCAVSYIAVKLYKRLRPERGSHD